MLESLKIRNIESHRNTIMKFHKGVNVIVGETDAGKSAIIRVLKWIIKNRPSGDEFISTGKKNCFSKLRIDGTSITRGKGKENFYKLGDKKYQAFGQSVPDDISELLNIADTNIEHQLDPHFLLSDSPAEVARYFNKIVKLDVIDRSLKNIGTRIRTDSSKLQEQKEEKTRLNEEIKTYKWLIEAGDEIRKLDIISKSIIRTSNQVVDIKQILDEVKSLEAEEKKLLKFSKAKKELNRLVELSKEINEIKEEYDELFDLVWDVKNYTKSIKKYEEEKKELTEKLKELMPDICPLCEQEVKK